MRDRRRVHRALGLPDWATGPTFEQAWHADGELGRLAQDADRLRRDWQRTVLVDAGCRPLRIGRQPTSRRPPATGPGMSDTRADGRSPTRASPGCAPASAWPSRTRMPPHYRCRRPTRSATWPRPTATTTRCGATRPTRAATRWDGRSRRRCSSAATRSIGDDEVTELDADTKALLKGDPLRGVHAFYAASAPASGGRRCARCATVARRNALVGRARQAERVRRAGRARVDRPGVPRGRRSAARRPVPADDPHRADQGARAQEVRRRSSSRRTPTTRSTRSRRSTRPSGRAAPSRAGGRTSTRATRSARW